jgi:hypothetical protein
VVTTVQVGFQAPGADDRVEQLSYFKAGAWAPVFAEVEGGAAGSPGGKLIVETTDSADVLNRYTVPVPAVSAGRRALVQAYVRPGCLGAEIRLTTVDSQGRKATFKGEKGYEALDVNKHLFVVLGAQAEEMQKAALRLEPDPARRARYTAFATRLDAMPDKWFGYQAVDLLLLTTGNREFLKGFLADTSGRKEALGSWVRRGGRLFLSVAPENVDLVVSLLEACKLPPVVRGRARELATGAPLGPLVQLAEAYGKPFERDSSGKLRVADLRAAGPGIGPTEVIAGESPDPPLLVRLPYGLGSMSVLAVDLSTGPVVSWAGRDQLWDKILTRFGPKIAAAEPSRSAAAAEQNDLATELQREMEELPRVEVMPFGLVAGLIFLYIMLIGPLDYLFLKKIVGRLEWTWLTFPVIIVGVSAAALLTVAGLTGKDQQINQVDLVEIDQLGPDARIQGTTWVTLYSPRIQTVTLGLEPSREWATPPKGNAAVPTLVGPIGRPESGGLNSIGRRRAQSLYEGAYDYSPDGAGVSGVPMPHASARTFQASWEVHFPRPFTAVLTYERGAAERLSGAVINHLPVAVQDAALFYSGKWYAFSEPLAPGRATALAMHGLRDLEEWLDNWPENQPDSTPSKLDRIFKSIFFHDKLSQSASARNHVLRSLDQSGRLRERSVRDERVREAILIGRLPRLQGPAEQVANDRGAPSRLWLGSLPGLGDKSAMRRPLAGTMTQVTYIRAYLLVEPSKTKPAGD